MTEHYDENQNAELERLLAEIQSGDENAINRFWDIHYEQLVLHARRKMASVNLRAVDEEDIALSAINSFYRGLSENRYKLQCNNELWKLLATIVVRKIAKQRKKFFAQKRGGGQVRGESFFTGDASSGDEERFGGIGNFKAQEDTHVLEVEFLDTCEKLFENFEDESTRHVARLFMEGYTIDEIADQLGCVRRTVERKLKRIREKWSQENEN